MSSTIPFAGARTALSARSKSLIPERADKAVRAPWICGLVRRPELLVFVALLVAFNVPMLVGSFSHSMIFQPAAVLSGGQWWRLVTHPFVHATWYHWLLDGVAFLSLYSGLDERSVLRRLGYVVSAGAGSLLISCAASPAISANGLCGLSGIAHGLMAISALEMIAKRPRQTPEFRIGLICFVLVVGKAAIEAASGRMFFTVLHFGLMGEPVAVAHAGGIVGSLLGLLLFNSECRRRTPHRAAMS